MKPLIAIPMLACVFATVARAASMDLAQAISRMESGNNSIQAHRQRLETATENKLAARGNFLPVIRLDFAAAHLDRDIVLDLDPIRAAMIQAQAGDAVALAKLEHAMKNPTSPQMPASSQLATKDIATSRWDAALPHFVKTSKEQDDWEASVVAYQPIFHGGRILAAHRVAASRQRAAQAELDRQENDLRRDFTRLYLQGCLLRASIALRNDAIASIQHHRDRAKNLVVQGMADRAALLRAEMTLAEAMTALSDDSAKLESISLTLAQMAGEDEPILPSDALPSPVEPASGAGIEREISERNPLVLSLAAQQEVAHRAVEVRNADFLPEIGAFGKYELNQDAAKAALAPGWVVGVRGTINIFRGGADFHSRLAARSTELEVAAMRREAQQALAAQSKRQFLTGKQARTRYANLVSQSDLARENHRVVSRRFDEGLSTSLEVVDAWLSMQKADLDRVGAASDAWIATQEVLWASGRTTEFIKLWNGAGK
ncbi:MAG: TolC family protein [Fibrobacteres bacterium]|nr:TolC family protein [Fibrobacterota bacterium]